MNDGAVGRWIGGVALLGAALPPLLGVVMVAVGWWSARANRPTFAHIRP